MQPGSLVLSAWEGELTYVYGYCLRDLSMHSIMLMEMAGMTIGDRGMSAVDVLTLGKLLSSPYSTQPSETTIRRFKGTLRDRVALWCMDPVYEKDKLISLGQRLGFFAEIMRKRSGSGRAPSSMWTWQFAATLHSETNLSDAEIWSMPLAKLNWYLGCIAERNAEKGKSALRSAKEIELAVQAKIKENPHYIRRKPRSWLRRVVRLLLFKE